MTNTATIIRTNARSVIQNYLATCCLIRMSSVDACLERRLTVLQAMDFMSGTTPQSVHVHGDLIRIGFGGDKVIMGYQTVEAAKQKLVAGLFALYFNQRLYGSLNGRRKGLSAA